MKFDVTCPHCGEEVSVETPVTVKATTCGKPVAEMTDEELRIELRNSKSVLYKATKRGASEALIAANQERVNLAEAERDARKAAVTEEAPTVEEEAPTVEEEAPTVEE